MKTYGVLLVAVCILGGCARQPPESAVRVVEMAPMQVGTKTPDYEVISTKELRLAPGARIEPVKDASGNDKGFVVMRDNNNGGFISCGCIGATIGNCQTENDNPDHPSCSGSCTDSEGNPRECSMTTEIGPPKDPYLLKYVTRARASKN